MTICLNRRFKDFNRDEAYSKIIHKDTTIFIDPMTGHIVYFIEDEKEDCRGGYLKAEAVKKYAIGLMLQADKREQLGIEEIETVNQGAN